MLVADDDPQVLECYLEAFAAENDNKKPDALDALAAELFEDGEERQQQPRFDIVVCTQGEEAIEKVQIARGAGEPFDVVILDIRMPPGIDGVEAGSRIREFESDAEIIFVSGFSDVSLDEMHERVPPPMRLHYFNKPLSFTKLAQDVVAMVRPE